jgi:endonuclease III
VTGRAKRKPARRLAVSSRKSVPTKKSAPRTKKSGAHRKKSAPRIKVFKGAELERQATEILSRLRVTYPDARTELNFRGAFELLVVTILSAQTTDVRVNMVSPALFARYPDAETLAAAEPVELEGIIKSTGFFHSKAKSLIGMAKALVERYGGTVPATMDDLVTLPGVGRKTANVVLGNAFGLNLGVVVDTHVGRLSMRLGLTSDSDPVKIEETLMSCVPRNDWTLFSHLLIWHGRRVCFARSPACDRCGLSDICPSAFKV